LPVLVGLAEVVLGVGVAELSCLLPPRHRGYFVGSHSRRARHVGNLFKGGDTAGCIRTTKFKKVRAVS